jgi:hypothetical protein
MMKEPRQSGELHNKNNHGSSEAAWREGSVTTVCSTVNKHALNFLCEGRSKSLHRGCKFGCKVGSAQTALSSRQRESCLTV